MLIHGKTTSSQFTFCFYFYFYPLQSSRIVNCFFFILWICTTCTCTFYIIFFRYRCAFLRSIAISMTTIAITNTLVVRQNDMKRYLYVFRSMLASYAYTTEKRTPTHQRQAQKKWGKERKYWKTHTKYNNIDELRRTHRELPLLFAIFIFIMFAFLLFFSVFLSHCILETGLLLL